MSILNFSWDNRGGRGPWGNGPRRPTNNAGGNKNDGGQQPDIDDMIRNAQDRLGRMMGGGRGPGGYGPNQDNPFTPRVMMLLAIAVVVLWLASGFYIVDQSERGVVLRFGKYATTTNPGLNYHLPWPIETVLRPKVERENRVDIGVSAQMAVNNFARKAAYGSSAAQRNPDASSESLMLTGDENIIDLSFSVRWKIRDPKAFLFNVYGPEKTIKDVAESAMREIVGKRPIDDALTSNKGEIEFAARALIQSILDGYGMGVQINAVELQQVNPPAQVIDAFKDVQAARADAEKMQNEAIGYANDILPRSRGKAAMIIQEAEGYKQARVSEARGQASRFNQQLAAYRQAKDITRRRMYLETMEDVLANGHAVILGDKNGRGILPYLPLNELGKQTQAAPANGSKK